MRLTGLQKLWDELKSSYWFIPSIMAAAAVVLAGVTTSLDRAVDHEWMAGLPFVFEYRAAGAREILSTIAGSLITVTGVVFSVTIVAVVYASGQRGARLLTNFMRDTGNQVTLGTFIGTFLYCLLILRTIRSPEEEGVAGVDEDDLAAGFIPELGMVTALLLTLCSIGVLIYFIHHVTGSIHISKVVGQIGRELGTKVGKRFPERFGRGIDDHGPIDVRAIEEQAVPVPAEADGYVQAVDEEALFDLAKEHDLVILLPHLPGLFIYPGTPLVRVHSASGVSDETCDRIRKSISAGDRRTPFQDFLFLVDELVEIAARALSPGVNDPFTAVRCIDWLADGTLAFGRRDVPSQCRFDDEGNLRVVARRITFEQFVEDGFGRLVPYAAPDRIAAERLMAVLGELGALLDEDRQRGPLREIADRLLAAVEELAPLAVQEVVRRQHGESMRRLRGQEARVGIGEAPA